jgi:hypothetical protein
MTVCDHAQGLAIGAAAMACQNQCVVPTQLDTWGCMCPCMKAAYLALDVAWAVSMECDDV